MNAHRRRLAVSLSGLAVLFVTVVLGASWTSASWADLEFGSGAFSAKTIPPPTISACTLAPGLLGANPVITITWQMPAGSGYSLSNIHFYKASAGLLPNLTEVLTGTAGLTTTGPASLNYTTSFGSGLLTGLLGGSYLVGLRSFENGWSSTLTSWTASMGALGVNPTCTANAQSP